MRYVGVDLHKHVMSVCVVGLENGRRHVVERRNLRCAETAEIQEFFQGLGEFQVVVEATSSYDWFAQLVEPLADRVVLAHPRKLRVIAESTRKTDKLDAQILAEFLAEFLAAGMIPEAYRASPRLRQYRTRVVKQLGRGKYPENTSVECAMVSRDLGRGCLAATVGQAAGGRLSAIGARNPRGGQGSTTANRSSGPSMIVLQQSAQSLAANDLAFGLPDFAFGLDWLRRRQLEGRGDQDNCRSTASHSHRNRRNSPGVRCAA